MKSSGTRVVAVAWVLGSLLAACGGSGASKPDGGGNAATVCADYAQKYCGRLLACEPGLLPIFGFATVDECRSFYIPGCTDLLTAPHTGDTPVLVQQCGDQLAAMSCTDVLERGLVAPACLPRGGTIPNGGSCNNDWQCATGRCFVSPNLTNGIRDCGTCVPVVPLGQTCDPNSLLGTACADGLVCAVTTVGGTTPVCAKSVAIGAACADLAVCPTNAYCDGTTHRCAQLPTIGEACDYSLAFYCDPTKAGALCDSTSSLCQPITVAKAGESCIPPTDDTTSVCLGFCATPADAGQDAGVGNCNPFVFEGQPCSASGVCYPGTSCSAGVCTAPVCGGTGPSGSDAATNAGPPARSALGGRNHIHLPGSAMATAIWSRP
jgi:hypothetical protein